MGTQRKLPAGPNMSSLFPASQTGCQIFHSCSMSLTIIIIIKKYSVSLEFFDPRPRPQNFIIDQVCSLTILHTYLMVWCVPVYSSLTLSYLLPTPIIPTLFPWAFLIFMSFCFVLGFLDFNRNFMCGQRFRTIHWSLVGSPSDI